MGIPPKRAVVSQAYKLALEREYLDLRELERLRWVEGWKIKRLADYFEISRMAAKEWFWAIKKNPGRVGISIPKKQIYGK